LMSLRDLEYWHLPESVIAEGRAVTMRPKARQVALEKVKPYAVGH
jgi:hypothetical protein